MTDNECTFSFTTIEELKAKLAAFTTLYAKPGQAVTPLIWGWYKQAGSYHTVFLTRSFNRVYKIGRKTITAEVDGKPLKLEIDLTDYKPLVRFSLD